MGFILLRLVRGGYGRRNSINRASGYFGHWGNCAAKRLIASQPTEFGVTRELESNFHHKFRMLGTL